MSHAYAERRRVALRAFEAGLAAEQFPDLSALAGSGVLLGSLMVQFGRYWHDHGYASYWSTHAILAVAGRDPFWKAFMAPARMVLQAWQDADPGRCQTVAPSVVIKAMVAVCLFWGWIHMAGLVLLGFGLMIWPVDFRSAERCKLSLPEDCFELRGNASVAVVVLLARRGARRRHSL